MTSSIQQYTKEQNPWYSFKPYQESDANNFKGRGSDITELMNFIEGNNLVVCYAKSGIGKSSLINAGLMPRMRRRQMLPIPIKFTEKFFVTNSFEDNIRSQINAEIDKLNKSAKEGKRNEFYSITKHPSVCDNSLMLALDAKLSQKSIWWWLSTYQIICKKGDFDFYYQPILIFDQFEELFQKTEKDEQREDFFRWLKEMSLTRPSDSIQNQIKIIQNQESHSDKNVVLPQNCEWKILLSLREEYVGLLDYWCFQRIRIPAVQDNRYCLMPLTIEQAEEVILQQTIDGQRIDVLDKYKQTIIDALKETDGVPAVLLSVLCNRIFDEEISGSANIARKLHHIASNAENPDDATKNTIHTLIRSVYEERVNEARVSKRTVRKIEQILVRDNGTRRRIELGELSESIQTGCNKLADVYLIRIENFGEKKGKDIKNVEIIHDRVAEVIAERRHEISKKSRIFWSRVALIMCFLIVFCFTYWNELTTTDKNKACLFPYIEYKDPTTIQTATSYKGNCENLWSLQTLICDTNVYVSNCPSLNVIDASGYKGASLSVRITGCENLKHIIFNDSIKQLSLEIDESPLVNQIDLPFDIKDLKLKVTSGRIKFKVKNSSSRYIWNNGILWDKKNDVIIYARSDAPGYIKIPSPQNEYVYIKRHFLNSNINYVRLALDWNKDTLIYKDSKSIDLSKYVICSIPKGIFKDFKELEIIKLPGGLKYVGDSAFYGCDKLDSVNFGNTSSLNIGKFAFANCKSILSIKLPEKAVIGESAFMDCPSLKEVICGEEVSLHSCSFGRCSSLKKVVLHNWNTFSRNAFWGCYNIEEFVCDTMFWKKAADGTVLCKGGYPDIIFTNCVKYHTYEDSIYHSKNGVLYKNQYEFNAPIDLVAPNARFFYNGQATINNTNNPDKMKMTLACCLFSSQDSLYYISELLFVPTNLSELHLQFSNMVKLSEIDNIVPDSIKEKITLYVPYNCSKYFVNHSSFKSFKEIKEETLFSTVGNIIKYHFEAGKDVVSYFNFWTTIVVLLIIATIALAWFVSYKKHSEEGIVSKEDKYLIILKSFTTVILIPCFYYIIYWFIFLTVLPLFHPKGTLLSSPWCFIPIFVVSSTIAIIAVYLILYSDGFNLNGFWLGVKNNFKLMKTIFTKAIKNPRKTLVFIILISLPFIIYCAYRKWIEYRMLQLQKATSEIKYKLELAHSNPNDASRIIYDVWKKHHNIIRGEVIEDSLYQTAYSALIKNGLMDTILNVCSYRLLSMPDGRLFFSNFGEGKAYLMEDNCDTTYLFKDYNYNLIHKNISYKFSNDGENIAFNHNRQLLLMNLITHQIDTLSKNSFMYDFHPTKTILAYKEDNQIKFYDFKQKKQYSIQQIYNMSSDINGICFRKDGSILAVSDSILLYQLEKNDWKEPICLVKGNKYLGYHNPQTLINDVFSVTHGDSLITWNISNTGKIKSKFYWKADDSFSFSIASDFSSDTQYALYYNYRIYSNVLTILDLSKSEKVYLKLFLPEACNSACFSKDGKSIYIALQNTIIRIPFYSSEQIFLLLKEKYKN